MSSDSSVLVTLGDQYSTIVQGPAKCYSIARTVCRSRPSGYQFMPRYRKKQWDGYIYLMRGKRRIPTGLLPSIMREWGKEGIQASFSNSEVHKLEFSAEVHSDLLNGVRLRDYQIDVLNKMLSPKRGIIKMATGSGKTLVLAGLIMLSGCRDALVVVHSKDLLYQTCDRLVQLLGVDVGMLGDSHRSYRRGGVTVSTIQTLYSIYRRDKAEFCSMVADNKLLIVDECHHISDNKQFDVLMEVPGWHRFGTSGTPLNRGDLDCLKLIACTGPVWADVSAADMIESGWAAKPIIVIHEVPPMDNADIWDLDYASAYDDCIVSNTHRNDMICQLARMEISLGHSVLIVVVRIQHGALLASQLGLFVEGYPVIFVNGSSPVDIRTQALGMLDDGPCIVIATVIFDEGVDVPGLNSMILAAGGASSIKVIQRIGRGLRPKEGRNEVTIHDFLDADNEYLLNHSEARLKTYEQERFEVRFDRCAE